MLHATHATLRTLRAPPNLPTISVARAVDGCRILPPREITETFIQALQKARRHLDVPVRSTSLITGEGFQTRRAACLGMGSMAASQILFGSAPVLSAVRRVEGGGEGGREVVILSSGVQYSDLSKGTGEPLKTGNLVVST